MCVNRISHYITLTGCYTIKPVNQQILYENVGIYIIFTKVWHKANKKKLPVIMLCEISLLAIVPCRGATVLTKNLRCWISAERLLETMKAINTVEIFFNYKIILGSIESSLGEWICLLVNFLLFFLGGGTQIHVSVKITWPQGVSVSVQKKWEPSLKMSKQRKTFCTQETIFFFFSFLSN